MLTQSSSAEVFYDKIRQELRVTSVHQCDSLKSLGRIIGAVTVAFLEDAPRYENDDLDDLDEVQSSDQTSNCVLDRSKVWEGIPSSLSLIPMPGAKLFSSQISKPVFQARDQNSIRSASKTRTGSDDSLPDGEVDVKSSFSKLSTRDDHEDLSTSSTSKLDKIIDMKKSKNIYSKRPRQLSKNDPELHDSYNRKQSKVMDKKFEETEWQGRSGTEHKKLSSPSVSNSMESVWRQDPVSSPQIISPESSTMDRRDTPSLTIYDYTSSKLSHSKPLERLKLRNLSCVDSESDGRTLPRNASNTREIEKVTIKEEVFHDLCHSSGELDVRQSSVSVFDEENETGDVMDEEYDEDDDNDAFIKDTGSDTTQGSSTYLLGDARSSLYSLYSGIGETAFPGISSTDFSQSIRESPHAVPGFPFTLPHSSYLSQNTSDVELSSQPNSTKLSQYSSSSSQLQLKSKGRKGHRKVPTCAVCFAEIKDKNDFATHASLHSLDDQHNCPVCLKMFSNRANLLRHSSLHILGVLYQCPICCKMIKRGDNFQVHMRKQHPGQSVKMARIISGFSHDSSRKTLYASTRAAITDERYQWFGKSSSSIKQEPDAFTGRLRLLSEGDLPICNSGTRTLTVADSSSERDSLDLSMQPCPCPYCDLSFSSSSFLAQHLEDVHTEINLGRSLSESQLHDNTNHIKTTSCHGDERSESVWQQFDNSDVVKKSDHATRSPATDLTD